MIDGEELMMMAAMISSNSLSRQGARTETSDPDLRFRDDGGGAELFLEISSLSGVFRVERIYSPKGRSGGHTGWPDTPQARPGVDPRLERVWPPCGPSALLLLAP